MKRIQIDKSLLWLYAISLIIFLRYYILYWGYNVRYDTWSYLKAYDTILREGIDVFRTPLYPLFLGVIHDLCGEAYPMVVPVVQYAVMLVALYYFYKLAKALINNGVIVFIVSMIYVAYPYGAKWCVLLLTESLAVSGATILLYILYRIYSDTKPSKKLYYLLGATLFLLFMLRPQFVYALPPLAIFALAIFIKKRNNLWRYALSVLIPCVALLAYCCGVYAKYGIFAPSSVSALNQYVMLNLMEDGHYNLDDRYRLPVEGDYHKSVQDTTLCSENDWKWGQITSKYSYPVVKEAVSNTLRLNISEYLRYRVDTHMEFWKWDKYTGLITEFGGLEIDTLSLIALKIFMMAVMAYFIYLAVYIWRYHEVPWFGLTVAVFALSNYAVTVIGAQSEWPRLCAPSLPSFMICIGQLLEAARLHFSNRKRHPKN